ncbi:hypothetical protein CSB37_02040 [bacterium DOLZORAL124_38_8]|nr:MAG: hypothetical protein CSB37_02040 [bacterium DOLZORAL124_38_8]
MESHYDQFAQNFSQTRQHGWPEFEKIAPLLKKHQRVLDLGCGNGRLRNFLPTDIIPQGFYHGFDLSKNMLRIAQESFPYDHFFQGSFANPLPFGSENFDLVISIAAFHHLLKPTEQTQCLSELFRITKPGGKVFLTTWKIPKKYRQYNWNRKDWWLSGFKNYLVPFGKDKHPRYYRTVPGKTLAKKMKNAGFKIISHQLFRGKNWIVIAEKPKNN